MNTSRRLENFADVSKSNCTSNTKLYLKNLANLNPRKHGFVPICAVSALELHALSRYPGNRQNDRMTDRNTDSCCACVPRHNNGRSLPEVTRGNQEQLLGGLTRLVNAQADCDCIHQLVLVANFSRALCRWLAYGLSQSMHVSHDVHTMTVELKQTVAASGKTNVFLGFGVDHCTAV